MKPKTDDSIKVSEPAKVDAYIKTVEHPLKKIVVALREIILRTDKQIGEEIKWNAPAFFYTGTMKPFEPKEYRRHFAVFNLHQQDCIRIVFPSGAKCDDHSGLLQGDYKDGRRLAVFYSMEEVTAQEKQLKKIIKKWLSLI